MDFGSVGASPWHLPTAPKGHFGEDETGLGSTRGLCESSEAPSSPPPPHWHEGQLNLILGLMSWPKALKERAGVQGEAQTQAARGNSSSWTHLNATKTQLEAKVKVNKKATLCT